MRAFYKLVIVLLILGAGLMAARWLTATKPTARRQPVSVGPALVDTVKALPEDIQVYIDAMGTVIPAREVTLQPRVSGKVVSVHPDLVPGGRFQEGKVILTIDDKDYQYALEQRKADVARARMELRSEEGRAAIAAQEWELLAGEIPTTPQGKALALRKPQIRSARAALEGTLGALKKARLDLERTVIKAPFNAFVKEKMVDLGQQVTPASPLVSLAGTNQFWVQISVPVDRLPYIRLPISNTKQGAETRIFQETGGRDPAAVRKGYVVRLLGELDPAGRMARLLVAIPDPLGLESPETDETDQNQESWESRREEIPLLLGAYVRVAVEGPVLEDVFSISRQTLREGDVVWLLDENDRLAMAQVEIVWRLKDDLLVRGLSPGSRIITSRISAPVPGMALIPSETRPDTDLPRTEEIQLDPEKG